MPPLRRAFWSIVLWLRLTEITLAALACVAPGLLPAAQCVPEIVPQTAAAPHFKSGCDERAAGHYAEAIQAFRQATRLWHETGDVHWEARSWVYVGSSQLLLFQYRTALQTTQAAAALASNAGEKAIAAGANGSTSPRSTRNWAISRSRGRSCWNPSGILNKLTERICWRKLITPFRTKRSGSEILTLVLSLPNFRSRPHSKRKSHY